MERPIRVEVQVLPKIQPFNLDLEGVEDQPFSVQCNATGKPQPTYTWISGMFRTYVVVAAINNFHLSKQFKFKFIFFFINKR